MSNGSDPNPPTVLTIPTVPPRCPSDVAVTNCKTAVIFSDKTPSFAAAFAAASSAASKVKPNDKPAAAAASAAAANLHCDFKAVWTYCPPPPADKLSVLIYLHGNNNWVRVDNSGACVLPDWSDPSDTIAARDPHTHALVTNCAPNGYQLAAAADANHQPIVLVPEDTHPTGAKHIHTIGGFTGKADLGALVDECFQHLSDVSFLKKDTACGGGPYLAKKPALTDIKRFFLSGHSGGGFPLFTAAVSDLVNAVPTDLCLLDCTYGWQGKDHLNYIDYCKTKKASLGNAAGQSRLLCFYLGFPIRDEATAKAQIKLQLERENQQNQAFNEKLDQTNADRATKHLPPLKEKPIVTITDALLKDKWKAQWDGSTKQHVEDDIIPGLKAAGFKFDTSLPASGASKGDAIQITSNLTDIETACTLYPIVFAAVSGVAHDFFPNTFIPIMLKTAKVV